MNAEAAALAGRVKGLRIDIVGIEGVAENILEEKRERSHGYHFSNVSIPVRNNGRCFA